MKKGLYIIYHKSGNILIFRLLEAIPFNFVTAGTVHTQKGEPQQGI